MLPARSDRGVLFDLDDTLFDHAHATRRALEALHAAEPMLQAWSPDELQERHSAVLEAIHHEVIAGRVSIEAARRERFRRLLADASGRPVEGREAVLARQYREEYERGWQPVPGAAELLAELRARGLAIGIVTNNLRAEQQLKLERCELTEHVDVLMTSEDAGVAKPHAAIFDAALSALRLEASQTVMVGDAWDTDIAGALAAGIRPVWFNRRRLPTRDASVQEVTSLTPPADVLRTLLSP